MANRHKLINQIMFSETRDQLELELFQQSYLIKKLISSVK